MAAKTITIKNKTKNAKLAVAADARNVSPVLTIANSEVPDQALTFEGRKILASNEAPTYFDPEDAFKADFGMPAGGVDLRVPVRKESNLEYVTVAPGKSFAYSTESETEVAVFEELKAKLDSNLFEITIA